MEKNPTGSPCSPDVVPPKSRSDTLPSPLNQKRWRMRIDSSFPLCGHKQPTVHYILSNCPEALQQGRYSWRHDCALLFLAEGIQAKLNNDTNLYADHPGRLASENPVSTIPENIIVTSAWPDIVLVRNSEVTLIELTILHNSMESISNARTRKSKKQLYQQALVA